MKKKENNKIKVLALQSYIDTENKEVCLFGNTVKFNDSQFFIVNMFYKWYEEEVQKNKGIK